MYLALHMGSIIHIASSEINGVFVSIIIDQSLHPHTYPSYHFNNISDASNLDTKLTILSSSACLRVA